MNSLPVKVGTAKKEDEQMFTATVTLPGAKPTKLVRKSDGSHLFGTESAALTSARNFAKKLGFESIEVVGGKKAASKSPRKSKKAVANETAPSDATD